MVFVSEQLEISRVTTNDFNQFLGRGVLMLHAEDVDVTRERITKGTTDFFVATIDGRPAGQVGIRWDGPRHPTVRRALELKEEETLPSIL